MHKVMDLVQFLLSKVIIFRQGRISTGSPCPICRDEYLVLDYRYLSCKNFVISFHLFRNVKLLQHFIDPYTGQTLPTTKTNICQKKFRLLDIEIERAKDHGLIEVTTFSYILANVSQILATTPTF